MATRSLGSLTLDLIARTGGFERGMDRAARTSRQRMQTIERQANRLARAMTVAFTGAVTAAAFQINRVLNQADEIGKMAERVGVGVESLSSLSFAADLSGTSLQSLGNSLQRLSANMQDTSNDTGQAREAFRALGIDVTDTNGDLRSSEDVLLDVSQRFAQMEDGAEKTALAMRLFGRSGAELIPLLNQGRDGLEAMQAEAERLGLVMSQDLTDAAQRVNDNFTRLSATFRGAWIQAVAASIDEIEDLQRTLQDPATIQAIQAIVNAFVTGFNRVISIVRDTVNVAQFLGEELAVMRFGIAADDVGRLEREADKINRILEGGFFSGTLQQLRFFGDDGLVQWYSEDDLRQELAEIEAQLERFYSGESIFSPRPDLPGVSEPPAPDLPDLSVPDQSEAATPTRNIDPIRDMIAALEREAETYGKVRSEIVAFDLAMEGATESQIAYAQSIVENLEAQQKQEDLMRRGEQVYESVRTPVEALNDRFRELNELLSAGAIDWVTYQRAVDQAQQQMLDMQDTAEETQEEMSEFAKQAARNVQDAFADLLFDPFNSSVEDMVRNFALAMNRLVAEALAAQALTAFSNAAGFPNIGNLFGGARADGGPVSPNKAYLVGERGPELFVPNSAGNITPNEEMGGGRNVRVVNVIDPAMAADYMNSPSGEETILNVLQRNAGSVRQLVT